MPQTQDRQGLSVAEHRALKSVAVQFFVNGAVLASYIPRLPEIRDTLGLSLPEIGTLLAVATGFGIMGSGLQAPVIAKFGTRRVMTVSSLVLVIGLGLVGVAGSTVTLVAALAVIAVSDVVTDVAMNVAGSSLSARRSVPVVNRLHGLWSLGTVVGGFVATATAAAGVSLRLHLLIAAAVLGVALIYVASGLLPNDDGLPGGESEASTQPMQRVSRTVATFVALGAFAIIPEMVSSDWAAFRLADDLGVDSGPAGFGFVAFTSGMVLGRFGADTIVSRHGSLVVLRFATALAALGILVAATVPSVPGVITGYVLAGLGISVMFPQLYDAAVRSPQSNSALGGLTAGSRVALLAMPVVVGTIADASTVGIAVLVVTIPAAIGVLALSTSIFAKSSYN